MNTSSTYDRIQAAADRGQISRKDAVVLSARLMFAPATIPTNSAFAPRAGELLVQPQCMTAFYKDVHRTFNELSADEQQLLASFSEDVRIIIEQKKREQSPQPPHPPKEQP